MQSDHDGPTDARGASLAPVGVMLGVISIAALVALLHHPVAHGGDPAGLLASMRAQAAMDQIVHGALAIIFGLLTVAMLLFAERLGVLRVPVLIGVVSYSCGLVLMLLAVMTDGFIGPAIAARCAAPQAPPSCAGEAVTMLRLGALQIEFLTRFSFAALAIAVLAWAGAMLRTPNLPRWAGLIGLGCGLLQLLALTATTARLDPHNLLFILAAQTVWSVLVAALMIIQLGPFRAAQG